MRINNFSLLLWWVFLFSCGENNSLSTGKNFSNGSVCYARTFKIETYASYTLVRIQNPWNKTRFLQKYVLVPRSKKLPKSLPEGVLIRTPVKRAVCFSSAICGIFDALGVLDVLIGVTEPQYINLPFVTEGISSGTIQDIGFSVNPNIEKLMFINPEVIFINPINTKTDVLDKLNIPVICCTDYMENHPLGQAEWIRFIGLLFDKKEFADSLFFEIMHSYNELKKLVTNVVFRPAVFTEMKYGNIWYMPGGKSYLAHMLYDAGANYILKDDPNTGSVSLSFETVLSKAEKADYWLIKYYSPQELTYEQLFKKCPNYALFDAYKSRNIYVCNTLKKSYYQELLLHPDWILKEMISLFHPDLLPNSSVHRYYRKLL
ncbi:ABC transporter substrate-binding protein [Candidatus Azobacteroides pseudotrichonymphae]|uniref:ABC-type Fe3+ transporter iron-binding component n=1 Tax=Azobacteroides pseudotrichonymphae genomovar. CFP2 TaxID=511995 RepID=B6YQ07_AZOPC|nr:ABC transporter substrate-binding protein [Candidatus Azobacteroides pseudotrichonymphae]BAG83279.1 ABC-type Fe3+ transporter iron-binding component [Candidatus Azobacteroides pseudotrichonymphae genomovar. CFP2]